MGFIPPDPLYIPLFLLIHGVPPAERCRAALFFMISLVSMSLPAVLAWHYKGEDGNFWAAIFTTNLATTSITVDAALFLVTLFLWLTHDMQQLGFSWWTFVLFVVGAGGIAVSLPFSLYLGFRTLQVAKLATIQQGGKFEADEMDFEAIYHNRQTIFCPAALLLIMAAVSQIAIVYTRT
jgi:hypothetical protein